MTTLITIEARMGSTRLPGKVLMPVCEKPILQHVIERLRRVRNADLIAVATTINPKDDAIESLCKELQCAYFRGSENDVLSRLIETGKHFTADLMVQMTADCPLLDPLITERAIEIYNDNQVDYVSNRLKRTYPTGVDPQVFKLTVLEQVAKLTDDPEDREHGSYYIYNHPELFTLLNFESTHINCPEKRWLLDYPEDYDFTCRVYDALYYNKPDFNMWDVLELLKRQPELDCINNMHPVTLNEYKHHYSTKDNSYEPEN